MERRRREWILLVVLILPALVLQLTSGLIPDPKFADLALSGIVNFPWINHRALYPFDLAVLAAIACLFAGRLLTARLNVTGGLSVVFLTGLLALSLWPILLGTLGMLNPVSAVGLMAAVIVYECASVPRVWREARSGLQREPREKFDSFARVLQVLVGVVCAWCLFLVVVPPVGMDALTYHLHLPDQYLRRGTLAPIGATGYHLFYQQFEMAVLPLVAVDGTGAAANIFGLAILAAMAAAARRMSGAGATNRIALVAILTSPLILNLLALTKNDLLACAFLLWAAVRLEENPRLAALFLGASIAVKPSAAISALPLLALLVVREPKKAAVPIGLAALFPLFWAGRNFIFSGSILPALVTDSAATRSIPWHTGPIQGLSHLVEAFFTHFSGGTDGPIGPLLLMLCVAAFVPDATRPKDPIRWCGLAALVLWLAVGRSQARFLLPMILLLAARGAASIADAGKFLRIAIVASAVVSLGASVQILEKEHGFLKIHSGEKKIEEYMLEWVDTWRVQDEASIKLPQDASVLAVGEAMLFPIHRRAEGDGYWEPCRALTWAHESHDPEHLRTRMLREGFTHVLHNPVILNQLIARGLTPAPACGRDTEMLTAMLAGCPLVVSDSDKGITVHSITR